MKTRYEIVAVTLFTAAVLTTGCSVKNSNLTEEKKPQPIEKEKKKKVIINKVSVKEATQKNTILLNQISSLETDLTTLERKIDETKLGLEKAKIIQKKIDIKKKIKEIRNQQIENAKEFQLSQHNKRANT